MDTHSAWKTLLLWEHVEEPEGEHIPGGTLPHGPTPGPPEGLHLPFTLMEQSVTHSRNQIEKKNCMEHHPAGTLGILHTDACTRSKVVSLPPFWSRT